MSQQAMSYEQDNPVEKFQLQLRDLALAASLNWPSNRWWLCWFDFHSPWGFHPNVFSFQCELKDGHQAAWYNVLIPRGHLESSRNLVFTFYLSAENAGGGGRAKRKIAFFLPSEMMRAKVHSLLTGLWKEKERNRPVGCQQMTSEW